MKIVAIGSVPLDFEIGCFNIIRDCVDKKHNVSLILVKNTKLTEKNKKALEDHYKKIGISKLYITNNFDYSRVSQENVNILNSILKKINPTLSFIPSTKSHNARKKILSESSLLACRSIENILMYETSKNIHFAPVVFFRVNKKAMNTISFNNKKKNTVNKTLKKKITSLQKMYSHNAKIDGFVEGFESHRMVLNNNDLF